MKRCLLAAFLFSLAWAQLPLQVEFPTGSSLQLSSRELSFDLSKSGFPPRELPAYYYPQAAGGGTELRLFSNLAGGWALTAGLEPLAGPGGNWLPPDRVEVRIDGGPWLPLSTAVVLLVGSGPTGGYQEHLVEFRLRVSGDELPGSYQGVLVFSLSRL
ncbi:hypothetical protein [Oceanithermus sp.]